MHLISLCGLASLFHLLKAALIANVSAQDGRGEELFQATIQLARGLGAVALGVTGIGVFSGLLTAMIDVAAAEPGLRAAAAAPGAGWMINTGLWGLIVATPLYLGALIVTYRRAMQRLSTRVG